MKQQEIDRLLTRSEVEQIFGISKRFLETAVQKNHGPRRIHLGRSVRYRVSDIRHWIERNAVGGN